MGRNHLIFIKDLLEDHQGFSGQCLCIKRKGQLGGSGSLLRGKFCFSRHGLLIDQQLFAGFLIHQRAADREGFPGNKVRIFRHIRNGCFRLCKPGLVSKLRICCSGADRRQNQRLRL